MLTAERLRALLRYEPETGHFFWIVKVAGRRIGDRAGSNMSHGYRAICVDGRDYTAHRLAWLYEHGEWPAAVIDHMNGDRADNRLSNLRSVTQVQNMQNVRLAKTNSKTGLRGVSLHKLSGKFTARIKVGPSYLSLGLYPTPEAASIAYEEARAAHHECFR